MAKKSLVPTLKLKGDDYIHAVPDEHNIELIIHWKGQGFTPEYINPVKAFAKQDGKLKIINRNLHDTCYTFDVKEIKCVYVIPMGE